MCTNDDNEHEGFKHIYLALQEKRTHIQYTTQKALKLQRYMLNLASHQKQVGEDAYRALNHLYVYRRHIEKIQASPETAPPLNMNKMLLLANELGFTADRIQKTTLDSANAIARIANSFLMTILKSQHYQWREKVYLSVLRRSDNVPTDDEFHCALGQWYHGDGRRDFGHLPAYSSLGDAHRKLHEISVQLAKEGFKSMDWSDITQRLDEFESASQQVIYTIDKLDEQILALLEQ
ncbi:CZB domain-containing protein [Hafnia paralvei]|uniref:CZB domain-containing protein n=1 Tax=Hafnia paralvei TaxID=546367 RepID=UPI0026DADE43|nr:CZB domain-containing protein [Hafnia paralvei]MDX6912856.1 CZB domain-containing protein [Hafnia paralvei]